MSLTSGDRFVAMLRIHRVVFHVERGLGSGTHSWSGFQSGLPSGIAGTPGFLVHYCYNDNSEGDQPSRFTENRKQKLASAITSRGFLPRSCVVGVTPFFRCHDRSIMYDAPSVNQCGI